MVEISFGLIRRSNPDINFDEINEVTSLTLSDLSITEMDNLEVFSHVAELVLSNNLIKKIENLYFFKNLLLLDISNNHIDTKGLRESIPNIPSSVETIILTGNPCASDEVVLGELQDNYPNLGIVIDTGDGDGDGDSEDETAEGEGEGEEGEGEETQKNEALAGPLNADAVLKSLVQRKCQLQSIQSTFSLASVQQELENELERTLQETQEKNNKKITGRQQQMKKTQEEEEEKEEEKENRNKEREGSERSQSRPETANSKFESSDGLKALPNYQARIDSLLEKSKQKLDSSSGQFMERLRATADQKMKEIKRIHTEEREQEEESKMKMKQADADSKETEVEVEVKVEEQASSKGHI